MAGRAWRYGLLGAGTVVVLAVGAGAVFLARFDPNSLKPRIEAAVQQATGRELGLYGPISLKWSLWPTIQLQDVTFANPPGYSRPQMATLQRLDLQLAVLPLLRRRFEIARLVLVQPDILLETDAHGHPNWQLTPPGKTAPTGKAAAPTGKAAPTGSDTTPTGSAASGSPPPGNGNTASAGGGPSNRSGEPAGSASGTRISFHDVQIEGGTLGWRNDRTGKSQSLALTSLTATSATPDANLTLAADATYNGVAAKLNGQVGPLSRLQQPDSDTPWPAKLTLQAAGATVSVDGALTRPLQGRGYTVALDATIPDLTAVAPLLRGSRLPGGQLPGGQLPGTRLPPLHDIHLTAKIAESGGRVPRIESATLHLGPADLDGYVHGLRIASIDIDAPQPNQPVKVAVQASLTDTPLTLAATVGVPAADVLHHPGVPAAAAKPVPLDLTLEAANASLTLKGSVAHPETLSGVDLAVGATIPDLSMLSALAHRRLPAVTQIALQGHLTDATGGFRQGATLQDMRLTTADGDLSGTIGVLAGPPRSLTGNLHANRIDADALLAAAGKPMSASTQGADGTPAPTQPSAAPTGAAPPPDATGAAPPSGATDAAPPPTASAPQAVPPSGASAPQAAPPLAAPPPVAPQPAGAHWLIPDTPIPFGLLRQANADLTLSVDDLETGGSDYRAVNAHVLLLDGKLTLAPLSADLPEGRLTGSMSVDAAVPAPPIVPAQSVAPAPSIAPARSIAPAPSIALTLHAPGLEVAPLLAAAGLPGYAAGRMEVYAELHGAGDTPHAIAAGLDGSLGLAMQNGTIDTQLLERLLGPMLQRANLSGLLSHRGSNDLRCFALRADMRQGVAELRALDLNSSVLSMDGTGSVNLGDETLALRLRPQGRLAGTIIVVPLQVTGPIRTPGVKVNALGAAASNAGTVAGAVIGTATPLGLLSGMLGGGKLLDPASPDACAGPLALARGEAPPPAAGSSAQAQPKPSAAGELLHDLFH